MLRLNRCTRALRARHTLPVLIQFCLFLAASISLAAVGDAPPSSTLVIAQHVETLGTLAREPMIVEHPDGTLFVAGYASMRQTARQTVPTLWKSADHGATWVPVNVGGEAEGAIANSDTDLAVAADGTLYFVNMGFDTKTFEGKHIVIGVSPDVGKTWHWTRLTTKRFDDRPWVAVSPNGTAHVIWNDDSGVYHTISRDRGASWSPAQKIHPAGGSSHLAIGPSGEVAVRVVPISASGNRFTEGVDRVLVSSDDGTTWQARAVPGTRAWAPIGTEGATPRWVEPMAWDSKGALYLFWAEASGVWLARSSDRGATWDKWLVSAVEGDAAAYYPFLAARGPGELAATWFSGVGESLRWQVCRIQVPDSAASIKVLKSSPMTPDIWQPADPSGNAPVRNTAGEYLPVFFLRQGDLAVISPIQNATANRFGFSFWQFKGKP